MKAFMIRPEILSNAQSDFLSCQYLGEGPYNKLYKICEYCGLYKKIVILNQPVYYQEGRKRKLVSYCWECCKDPDNKKDLKVADHKYQAYDIVLETIRQLTLNKAKSGRCEIRFEDAVKKACKENKLVDGYLGYSEQQENQNTDNWNYKQRLWEFSYKIQYEEPLVKTIQENPLILECYYRLLYQAMMTWFVYCF
jgi:hypothetical protein